MFKQSFDSKAFPLPDFHLDKLEPGKQYVVGEWPV